MASVLAPVGLVVRAERCARDRIDGSPMNAYERERAECAADEEARADRRLRAWHRRHTSTLAVRACELTGSHRAGGNLTGLRKAG